MPKAGWSNRRLLEPSLKLAWSFEVVQQCFLVCNLYSIHSSSGMLAGEASWFFSLIDQMVKSLLPGHKCPLKSLFGCTVWVDTHHQSYRAGIITQVFSSILPWSEKYIGMDNDLVVLRCPPATGSRRRKTGNMVESLSVLLDRGDRLRTGQLSQVMPWVLLWDILPSGAKSLLLLAWENGNGVCAKLECR